MKRFETVTIYRKNLTPDGIKWDAFAYDTAYVSFKHQEADYINDRFKSTKAIVRVFTSTNICDVGDFLCFGLTADETPPEDALVVTEVKDNFDCSASMHHVRIAAR